MDFGAEQGYSIGDNAHKDLLPAKEAGFKTILFGDKKKVSGVDYKIDDLAKLKEIINLKNDN
jgi:FMN phosphatase YigB (HAD superfamily)